MPSSRELKDNEASKARIEILAPSDVVFLETLKTYLICISICEQRLVALPKYTNRPMNGETGHDWEAFSTNDFPNLMSRNQQLSIIAPKYFLLENLQKVR